MATKKAVFLDRDGTINKEVHYLHEPEKFEFETGVLEALKKLKENGFLLIVVTNQGGVAKGLYGIEDVEKTHAYMVQQLEQHGIHMDDIFYCPHSPKGLEGSELKGDCICRKPNPGMILKGIEKYNLRKEDSWMIGDKLSDIEAGKRACVRTILVRTGYGAEEEKLLEQLRKDTSKQDVEWKYPDYIADNLLEAATIIIEEEEKKKLNKI